MKRTLVLLSLLFAAAPLAAQSEVEELRAMLKALQEQQQSVLDADRALSRKLDDLARAAGASLHGRFSAESVNTLQMPVVGPLRRAWPTVGIADVSFHARPKQSIHGWATLSMVHIFGDGVVSQYGVRWFQLESLTPLWFRVGDQRVQQSPLTLWAIEDPTGLESSAVARRRAEGMERLYLGDGQWPLRGLSMGTTLVWAEAVESAFSGTAARLGVPGSANSGFAFSDVWPYEQWLFLGRAQLQGLDAKGPLAVGATWVEIMDLPDTLLPTATPALDRPLRNATLALDAVLSLFDGRLSATVETAQSNAHPDYGGQADWTSGRASRLALAVSAGPVQAEAWGLSNEESFINYAAQTRVHDAYNSVTMVTANNLFNPATQDYGLPKAPAVSAYTRFNRAIQASFRRSGLVKNAVPGGQYLSHDPLRNNSLPLGLATPNRVGGGAGLRFKAGPFSAWARGSSLQEAVQPWYERLPQVGVPAQGGPRTYTRGEGGAALRRPAGLPFSLEGAAGAEDTKGNTPIGLSSARFMAEATLHLGARLDLAGGLEHLDANGAEVVETSPGLHAWTWRDVVWDTWSVELRWRPSPASLGVLSYLYHDLVETLDAAGNAGLGNQNSQELAASFRLEF